MNEAALRAIQRRAEDGEMFPPEVVLALLDLIKDLAASDLKTHVRACMAEREVRAFMEGR